MLQRQVRELLVEPAHENVVSTRTLGVIVNGLLVLLAQHESECLDELVHALLGAAPQRRSARQRSNGVQVNAQSTGSHALEYESELYLAFRQ
jgi:hypothetical protein